MDRRNPSPGLERARTAVVAFAMGAALVCTALVLPRAAMGQSGELEDLPRGFENLQTRYEIARDLWTAALLAEDLFRVQFQQAGERHRATSASADSARAFARFMDEWNAIQPDWDAAKAEVARATQAMTLAWEALFDALSGEYERLSGRLAGATPARRVSIQDAMNQVRLRVNELQRDQSRIRVPIIRTSWISHQPIDTPDITAFKKARLRGQIEQIDEDIERTSAERDRLERIQRGEDALARVNRDMFDSHVSAAGPPRAGDATSPIPNQPPGETNFEELSTAERLGTVRLYLDALVEFRASLDEELRRFPPGIGEGA